MKTEKLGSETSIKFMPWRHILVQSSSLRTLDRPLKSGTDWHNNPWSMTEKWNEPDSHNKEHSTFLLVYKSGLFTSKNVSNFVSTVCGPCTLVLSFISCLFARFFGIPQLRFSLIIL